MDDAETKYHVIRSWWLPSEAASEESILGLSEWLGIWHFYYRQWGGHMPLESIYQTSLFNVIQKNLFIYIYLIFIILIFVYYS